MIIEENKVVSLSYELRKENREGAVIESIPADEAFTFIFGSGELLPKFEENINGLNVGSDFSFQITCQDAYGEKDEEAIVDIPKNAFVIDGKVDEKMLAIGNTIPMQNSEGKQLYGTVTEVGDENVLMDFNHPLAGDDLYFSGTITDIREATEDELENGLSSGCGGDCNCGDDCECSEDEESKGGCGGGCGCH